jgi:hypothetical protein
VGLLVGEWEHLGEQVSDQNQDGNGEPLPFEWGVVFLDWGSWSCSAVLLNFVTSASWNFEMNPFVPMIVLTVNIYSASMF